MWSHQTLCCYYVTSEICVLVCGMNIISGVQKQIFGRMNDEVEWFRMFCSKNVHKLEYS